MAVAIEFDSYRIISEVEGDSVFNTFEIELFNDGDTALDGSSISLAPDSDVINVADSYGDLDFDAIEQENVELSFVFTTPIEPDEKRLLTIATKTQSNLVNKESYFEYILVMVPGKNVEGFEHVLKIPESVEEKEITRLIVPDAEVETIGEQIFITWNVDLEKSEPIVFLARFHKEEPPNYWAYTAIILILGICSYWGWFFGKRIYRKVQRMKQLESVKILNEKEKEVLECIINRPGIKQYEIMRKMDLSKSSLSKIIKKMEMRGLVISKKYGKINQLYLGEKFE